MFVLTLLAKRVFFQLNSKYKVGSSLRIYCSFPVSVKQNTPILPNTCFASEPYSLPMISLETFQSGWFHECIYATAETTKLYNSSNQRSSLCSTRQRLRSQHKRKHYALCLNRWQYQSKCFHYYPRNFHFKGDLPTKTSHNWEQDRIGITGGAHNLFV